MRGRGGIGICIFLWGFRGPDAATTISKNRSLKIKNIVKSLLLLWLVEFRTVGPDCCVENSTREEIILEKSAD
jgi:hypothetical protein